MTREEILTKAVEKAISNGYILGDTTNYPKLTSDGRYTKETFGNGVYFTSAIPYYKMFIFSHSFAKALWSEVPLHQEWPDRDLTRTKGLNTPYGQLKYSYDEGGTVELITPAWQHHLQCMVISDDPIKYLGENL